MRLITAKFKSICNNTGQTIKKGEKMYYNYSTKKCYSVESVEAENKSTSDMIQANEDQYFDNFCQVNNIYPPGLACPCICR